MFPIPSPDFANGLSIIESYQYFDRPVLFSCKDQLGEIYLSVWVAHDEDTGEETWLFTPVHWGIWQATRSGGIDLHDAFKSSKSGKVYIVTVDWDKHSANSRLMPSHDLDANWLPLIGERLDLIKSDPLLPLNQLSEELNKVVQDIILQPQSVSDGLSVKLTSKRIS